MPKRRLPPMPREASVSAKSLRLGREDLLFAAIMLDDDVTVRRRLCLRGSGPSDTIDLHRGVGEENRISLLQAAALWEAYKVTRLLLSMGADPKAPEPIIQSNPRYCCPFCAAFCTGHWSFLELCFEAGMSPARCSCRKSPKTMLSASFALDNKESMLAGLRLWLRNGEPATTRGIFLCSPIILDAFVAVDDERRVAAARLLLRAGAVVNAALLRTVDHFRERVVHPYGEGAEALLERMRREPGPPRLTLLSAAAVRGVAKLRKLARSDASFGGALPRHLADLVALRGSDRVDLAM